MNQVRMAANPQYALQQLLISNPQLSNAINFIKQGGGDPKAAFYNLAQQMGVDPNEVLNVLK